MAKRLNYAKPICHACNRPFDPSSPGATRTMGPTCAKRALYQHTNEEAWQLSFERELGSHAKPAPRKHSSLRRPRAELPPHLLERYHLAKMAFDELFREFCKDGTLLYGERALAFDIMLNSPAYDRHDFDDDLLDWLEPEHELQLFLSEHDTTAFHRRTVNGTVSLLLFNANSPQARPHLATIVSFTKAMRRHRENEEIGQLSLFVIAPELGG